MGVGSDGRARRNHLLAALSAPEQAALAPRLERVSAVQGEVLFEPDEECHHVWFPESCVLSLVVVMEGGQSAEAASVRP